MSKSVAQRLVAPRWLPNTPPLTVWLNGEWADSNGLQANGFENLKCRRGPAVNVHMSVAPIPSAFGETGQGNSVLGSAYCSASLRTADYNHHKFHTLKEIYGGNLSDPAI